MRRLLRYLSLGLGSIAAFLSCDSGTVRDIYNEPNIEDVLPDAPENLDEHDSFLGEEGLFGLDSGEQDIFTDQDIRVNPPEGKQIRSIEWYVNGELLNVNGNPENEMTHSFVLPSTAFAKHDTIRAEVLYTDNTKGTFSAEIKNSFPEAFLVKGEDSIEQIWSTDKDQEPVKVTRTNIDGQDFLIANDGEENGEPMPIYDMQKKDCKTVVLNEKMYQDATIDTLTGDWNADSTLLAISSRFGLYVNIYISQFNAPVEIDRAELKLKREDNTGSLTFRAYFLDSFNFGEIPELDEEVASVASGSSTIKIDRLHDVVERELNQGSRNVRLLVLTDSAVIEYMKANESKNAETRMFVKGESCGQESEPPFPADMELIPYPKTTSDENLNAVLAPEDADYRNVEWSLEGVLVGEGFTLPASETDQGDDFDVTGTVQSGETTATLLDAVKINNPPVVIVDYIENPTARFVNADVQSAAPSYTMVAEYSDPDPEDTVTVTEQKWTGLDADGAPVFTVQGDTVQASDYDGTEATTLEAKTTVSDGYESASDTTTVPIEAQSNNPPEITNHDISPDPAFTDTSLSAVYETDDLDGDPVTVSSTWFVNDDLAGTGDNLSSSAFAKNDEVRLESIPNDGTEDGAMASSSRTIKNSSPSLDAIADQRTDEGQEMTCQLTAQDADNDSLVFAADFSDLPAGNNASITAGLVRWTPSYNDAGTYQIPISVDDQDSGVDQAVLTMIVDPVNRAPALNPIGDKNVDENQLLEIVINAADPDAEDTLTYTAENLPTGATFNPTTRTFSWTPDYTQAGNYDITFRASDGNLDDSETITILVNDMNRTPILDAIGNKNVDENALLEFIINATDPDAEDTLTYTAENLPTGATFDPATRTFSWTPDYTQAGNYDITFRASDGNLDDSETITILVNDMNRTPILDAIGNKNVDENALLEFIINATDPDAEDTLTYTAENLPTGATFNPTTRTFTWTPDFTQAGNYNITFKVNDSNDGQDEETVTIIVGNVNRPPVLDTGNQHGTEGILFEFYANGIDPDTDDILTYSADSLPFGASFDDATGLFSWTPGFEQSGTYPLLLRVEDNHGAYDTESITLAVSNVNRSPQINSATVSDLDPAPGFDCLSVSADVTDPDGDPTGILLEWYEEGIKVSEESIYCPTEENKNIEVIITACDAETCSEPETVTGIQTQTAQETTIPAEADAYTIEEQNCAFHASQAYFVLHTASYPNRVLIRFQDPGTDKYVAEANFDLSTFILLFDGIHSTIKARKVTSGWNEADPADCSNLPTTDPDPVFTGTIYAAEEGEVATTISLPGSLLDEWSAGSNHGIELTVSQEQPGDSLGEYSLHARESGALGPALKIVYYNK